MARNDSSNGQRVSRTNVHRVVRGGDLLCEGTELRAFCVRDPDDPDRIRAIPIPEDIRALCTTPQTAR